MNRNALGRAVQFVIRAAPVFVAGLLVLDPPAAAAGQIYGQITANGRSVSAGVTVSLDCGAEPALVANTDRFGSYQIYAPRAGRCRMTIAFGGAKLSADVVSYANPTRYNFDVVGRGGDMRLVRR